ncbi:hypothetical protein [Phenylobacterium sp.]|uniref:hypothetical protein n=1 Tax=Phenylobacterium sp. TaxID=1871053 RepID=UPI00301D854E
MKNTLFGALLDAEGTASGLLAPAEALAATAPGVRTTRDGIPIEQILRDRPDVFRAFDTFHGGGNDLHSSAWIQRVGGTTVEDYANYWYEQYGRWEGYGQGGSGGAAAPLEDGGFVLPPGILETGRTTVEGYLLSQILTERPDVFRAFFTEFHGPNNDRNSSAWVDRVGGTTVEDYANYWWETHGRSSGWTPGQGGQDGGGGAPPDAEGEPEDPLPSEEPLVFEFTEAGIVMRPARPDDIIEGGIVVGRRPGDDSGGQATGGFDLWAGMARPLIYEPKSDGGFDLRPAAPNEIVEDGVVVGYAFFTPDPFG